MVSCIEIHIQKWIEKLIQKQKFIFLIYTKLKFGPPHLVKSALLTDMKTVNKKHSYTLV